MAKVENKKKLSMKDYLFHGIEAYFTRGYSSELEEESEILRTILNTKFIASRKYLKSILEKDKMMALGFRDVQYYIKENSVSIYRTRDSSTFDAFDLDRFSHDYWDDNLYFAYYSYKDKPAIILSNKLLDDLTRIITEWAMYGEIQIEDKIPDNYFVGIALPNINLNSSLEKTIESSDMSFYTMKQDLIKLSEEEFVNKYYQDVILFERVLKETGSNLKLYHTETGEEIMSQNEEKEHIKEFRKLINS